MNHSIPTYKFEQLDVWKMSLEYIDRSYELASRLPKFEEYNLKSQLVRSSTSVGLNVAEGSTGLSDAEQSRFLGIASRSFLESVACGRIIERREYVQADDDAYLRFCHEGFALFKSLQAFRRALR